MKKLKPLTFSISSPLAASQEELWTWLTSPAGVKSEFPWWMSMSFPRGVDDLATTNVPLGQPLFTSWLRLVGVLPLGRIRLTFTELRMGVGFVEQSPMTSMRLWRHERWLEVAEENLDGTVLLHDRLTFQPMLSLPLVRKLVHSVIAAQFKHRHAVLRERFGSTVS